jgi:hypothetical protein
MDTPLPPNDVNALERRLAAWQPSAAGLDTARMLYAAGRASVGAPRARLAWPILSACLAVAAVALGAWVATERAERLALARQLQPRTPAVSPSPAPSSASPADAPATEVAPPDSYLATRRLLEQDPRTWPATTLAHADPVPAPERRRRTIPSVWERDQFLEP